MSAFVEIHKPNVEALHKLADKLTGVKTVDHRFDEDSSSAQVNRYGKYGEFAGAKWAGVKMNTEVHMGGDAGYDFIWEDYTVEVKFNTWFNGTFYMNQLEPQKKKSMRADLGLLTVCGNLGADPIRIKIAGWIDYRRFYKLQQKKKYKTTVYAVEQHLLSEITTPQTLKVDLEFAQINPGESKLPLPFEL